MKNVWKRIKIWYWERTLSFNMRMLVSAQKGVETKTPPLDPWRYDEVQAIGDRIELCRNKLFVLEDVR